MFELQYPVLGYPCNLIVTHSPNKTLSGAEPTETPEAETRKLGSQILCRE